MSFGTGHHATTYLMLQQMQHISFTGKSVLDFGTGTGVLAIMAKKLGAQKVVGIDYDEWSINNAKENILINETNDIEVTLKDNLNGFEKFDIILANINLNVIINSLKGLKYVTQQSSTLLLSGFLKSDEDILTQNFLAEGFRYVSTIQKNEWITIQLMKS